ncbi:MAG: hypothetical protein RIU67_1911, partial [Actinomycetota bacterium]
MSAVVVARRLTVGYHEHRVLEGVDTFLASGGSIALVGSNGSGKSTLLKTFAGLLEPLGGVVEVLGGAPREASRSIAYVSQFHRNALALPLRAIDVVRMARFDHRGRFARASAEDE